MDDNEDPVLYQDVKAAQVVSRALVPTTNAPDLTGLPVGAVERGHREWPSGMTEEYERIEFQGP